MRLLDLFCGAGGAAKGYADVGWEVVGVDIRPQPRYPFEFVLSDWEAAATGDWLDEFDAIHASPPCQRYSVAVLHKERRPDLLGTVRERLVSAGLPWVIENVPGAPMRADYLLCGSMFGLPGLIRHRLFETSWRGFEMAPPCRHDFEVVTVAGHGPNQHSPFRELRGRGAWERLKRDAMGIDWPMTREELSEAVPPAYTAYIGTRLLRAADGRLSAPLGPEG